MVDREIRDGFEYIRNSMGKGWRVIARELDEVYTPKELREMRKADQPQVIDRYIVHSEVDGEPVTGLGGAFQNFGTAETGIKIVLDLSKSDFSNIRSMRRMFEGCTILNKVIWGNSVASKLSSIAEMFKLCSALKEGTLPKMGLDMTDASGLWRQCTSLKKVDITNLSPAVRYANSMFRACGLETLDLSEVKLSRLAEVPWMFQDCTNLREIKLWNTRNNIIDDAAWMFYGCSKLKEVDMGETTFSKYASLTNIFGHCTALEYVDLSKTEISKDSLLASAFYECRRLKRVDFPERFATTPTEENVESMFEGAWGTDIIDLSGISSSRQSKKILLEHLIGSYTLKGTSFDKKIIITDGTIGTLMDMNWIDCDSYEEAMKMAKRMQLMGLEETFMLRVRKGKGNRR